MRRGLTRKVIGRGHNCKLCGIPLRSGNPEICYNCRKKIPKNKKG